MRGIAVVQGALTAIFLRRAAALFVRTDLSVALVFENSHGAKPFIYKVAGAWGNHEGSMLLWVTVLAVAGRAVALLSHRTSDGPGSPRSARRRRSRSVSTPSC